MTNTIKYFDAYHESQRTYMREYLKDPAHQARNREKTRGYHYRDKVEVLVHYSGTNPPQCANPFGEHKEPYINLAALSLDHINDDGAMERKALYGKNYGMGGYTFYRLLKKRGYPDGYQVLCMNCQYIKRNEKYIRDRLASS